ncbi:MAG: methyltransferase domain-containing protein [Phycisphaerales bacterium]|nr:MAG: methyltransferase domain-containing protein [Phycisphaerales bacterium]
MASKSLRFAGLELVVRLNKSALSMTGAISGRLIAALYERLRSWVRHGRTTEQLLEEVEIPEDASPEKKALLERVKSTGWYHSIDLGNSAVTPGAFDHRHVLHKYALPERMDGLRVLDVATFDGFWAFEFERRGAGEVVALDLERFGDIDLPPKVRAKMSSEALAEAIGKGFAIARDVLGSKVRREVLSVYDLSPERLGKFDVVHSGDLLLHLMNPMKALQNICSVTEKYALISDYYHADLDRMDSECVMQYMGGHTDCVWWKASLSALQQMILDAGFERIELLSKFLFGFRGDRYTMNHAVIKAFPPPKINSQSTS